MKKTDSLKQLVAGTFQADQPEAMTVTLPVSPDWPSSPPRRKKLWDLESKHHCPVIGTCLPMDDLVKFARRFAFSGSLRDELSLHVEAVGWAGTRNAVSEALQKHLDRKYEAHLKRFERAKSDKDVRAMWKECYAQGEVAGPMWAALTHKAASAETRQTVYGEVHMLSHQVGAGQAADARRLAHLDRENGELKASLDRERRERSSNEATWRAQVHTLEARVVRLHTETAEVSMLRGRLAAFESGVVMVDIGRKLMTLQTANDQLIGSARRADELEKKLARLAGEMRAMRTERDQLACERAALERLLLAADTGEPECDGQGAACDRTTQNRCVLCVGGRTALVAQYRALAERLGIRFIHHDGGQEEALSRLPDMINGADAVICPTDCVSHSAYYQLKRHCKRTGKPCLLFKGAGVSSFAVALTRLSSGRLSLAGDTAEALR